MKLVEILSELSGVTNSCNRAIAVIAPIYLENGRYFLSVQASAFHYCLPKKTIALNKYTHFEVLTSLPKEDIPQKWFDDYNNEEGQLFSFVPKDEIEDLLAVVDKKYGIYL